MKRNIISGGAAVLFGLLLALGPQFLFKICGSSHNSEQLQFCYWAARGEIAAGILIAALGIFIILLSDIKVQMGLTISIFLAGIVALLIPFRDFYGFCADTSMRCNTVTFPALVVICSLLIIGTVVNTIYLEKKTRS